MIGVRAVEFGHAIRSMKINGFDLREAIRHWSARKTLLGKVFVDAGFAYTGESKPAPAEVSAQLEQASRHLAELEVLQAQYNRSQRLHFEGGEINLAVGLKLAGAMTQQSNMWRGYAERGLLTFAAYRDDLTQGRKADENFAKRQMPSAMAMAKAEDYLRRAAQLRGAIALANANSMELADDLAPLFSRGD